MEKQECENCPEDGPRGKAKYILSIQRVNREDNIDEIYLCEKCAKFGGFVLSVNGNKLECD